MEDDLRIVRDVQREGVITGYMIFCPACECGHFFDERWTFNGDRVKPTFVPSMLCNPDQTGPRGNPATPRCHSFVTNGEIRFLDDCSHELKGQTVPLEPF